MLSRDFHQTHWAKIAFFAYPALKTVAPRMALGEEEIRIPFAVNLPFNYQDCMTPGSNEKDRLFSYKFTIKNAKQRPKIERRKIGINAQRLHSQMYTALAE